MPDATERGAQSIDAFFATPSAREDHWRDLVDAARSWSAGTGARANFVEALEQAAAGSIRRIWEDRAVVSRDNVCPLTSRGNVLR
jgi:hypothetical protein